MPARMKQKVQDTVHIEPDKLLQHPEHKVGERRPPVHEGLWATAMRLTGKSLKGMRTYGHNEVDFPVESLSEEGLAELARLGLLINHPRTKDIP